jgi:hypothetical protein
MKLFNKSGDRKAGKETAGEATRLVGDRAGQRSSPALETVEEPTRLLPGRPSPGARRPFSPNERAAADEPQTRLAGGRPGSRPAEDTESDGEFDPVVGWLVVLDGPGRGHAVSIGYGMNALGRDDDQRLKFDFGDDKISRARHALITFDPRSCRFFIQHGGGRNLTYLGSEPLLNVAELSGGEDIQVGDTKLRFVAFCGKEFRWDA